MRNAVMRWVCMVAAAALLVAGCDRATPPGGEPTPQPPPVDGVGQTVTLVIEMGETTRRFEAVPWEAGMTVQSVMDAAGDEAGGLDYTFTGSGATAILKSIEGIENEGGGRDARNWLYWVGDEFGTRSFALAQVGPGDTVAWRFVPYDAGP